MNSFGKHVKVDRQSALASGLFLLGFIILGMVIYLNVALQPLKLDDDLCLAGKPLEKTSIVIVDETDKLSPEQVNAVRNRIDTAKERVSEHELFAIYLVRDASPKQIREAPPLFYACNPGSGNGGNPAYQNLKRMQNRYDRDFDSKYRPLLERLLKEPESPTSPIIATLLRAVSNKSATQSAREKRMLLITDLYENSSYGTLYRHARGASANALTLEKMSALVQGNEQALANTRLHLVLIRREGHWEHQQEIKDLWLKFFRGLKVDVTVDPI